ITRVALRATENFKIFRAKASLVHFLSPNGGQATKTYFCRRSPFLYKFEELNVLYFGPIHHQVFATLRPDVLSAPAQKKEI
ncbi:MAG TPA: hypothetical protein VJG90_06275, partial [Candidatus Nanoarchaeia archaeon]|nr:hypothetical protein [Candidatus Nanoarchaeia archaeon]